MRAFLVGLGLGLGWLGCGWVGGVWVWVAMCWVGVCHAEARAPRHQTKAPPHPKTNRTLLCACMILGLFRSCRAYFSPCTMAAAPALPAANRSRTYAVSAAGRWGLEGGSVEGLRG